MYKEYHSVPYNSKIEEAIVGSLSWGQLAWIAPAALLTIPMTQLPTLPFDSFLFARIHWVLPLLIAVTFIKVKHPKTNLTLSKYLVLMFKFKNKRKKFIYQRENLTKYIRHTKGESLDGEKTDQ